MTSETSPTAMALGSAASSPVSTYVSAAKLVSSQRLGIPEEAWKASSVLGANYADSYWYRQSLRLLIKERQHTRGKAFGVNELAPATASNSRLPKAARVSPPNAVAYPDPKE